ncbi:MAG: hypothetical protein ACREA9_21090 [Pyrinomonadaceae bacterium]
MLYRLIFLFNVLVTLVAAGLAGYGLFLAVVEWQLFHALAYYVLALFVRCAFVDLPEPAAAG